MTYLKAKLYKKEVALRLLLFYSLSFYITYIIIDNKITAKIFILDNIGIIPIFLGLLMTYLYRKIDSGQFFKGTKIKFSKSYSKANRYFNKEWISNNFPNYVKDHPEFLK